MLRATLFGGLAVERDGNVLPALPGHRPRAVLAYLLAHPGPHPRARLAARFWPDVLDTSARASLRSCLWSVRAGLAAIGAEAYLVSDRDAVGIASDLPREVDLEEYRRLLATGDPASLERAIALSDTGMLLIEIADEWAMEAQDAVREERIAALLALADDAEARSDLPAASALTRRALDEDRLREETVRLLMRRLAAAGERASALAAYRRLRDLLSAELGIAPSSATRAAADELRGGVGTKANEPPPVVASPRNPRPRTALVGRERELDGLLAAWRTVREGRGSLATVTGPAGIGKTRLVTELACLVVGQGGRVAQGASLELGGGPPYGVWSEALREIALASPPPPAETRWPSNLAHLCPAVVSQWGCAPTSDVPDRSHLFEAVVEAATWAARGTPLLLLLEDLHAADAGSVTLLAAVARRLAELPVLVVVTRRPSPPRPDLDMALDGLCRRDGVALELQLAPLPLEALTALALGVAPELGADAARRVASLAEGSPLLAREGARATAGGREPAEDLRASVRGPLGSLTSDARMLVELAAAAGRALSPRESATLMDPDRLHGALVAGHSAGLLDPDAEGVRLVHDLVREACYRETPRARRAHVHARLAELLRTCGEHRPAEVARHLVLAGDGEAAIAPLFEAAADARRLGAFEDAAGFLGESISLSGRDRLGQAELWLALAEVEALRERRADMDDAFGRALALLEAEGDEQALASAYCTRGHLLRTGLCFPREALTAYRTALALLDAQGDETPELRVLALAGVAWAEAMSGDPEAVAPLIRMVESIPEAHGDDALAVQLDLARMASSIRADRLKEADELGPRTIAMARRSRRPDLLCISYVNWSAAVACQGRFERVVELADDALAEAFVGPSLEGDMHAARAYALSRLGRHDDAAAAAREGLSLARRYGRREFEATALFDLGSVLLAAGRADEGARHLLASLDDEASQFPRALARLRLAEALVLSGEVHAAREALGAVPFEPVGPADHARTLVPRLARVQGLVAAAEGDVALAERRLEEAERGWRREVGAAVSAGDVFATTITDLGRPPMAGLVEPALELWRTLADRASLTEPSPERDEEIRALGAALGGPREASAVARILAEREAHLAGI